MVECQLNSLPSENHPRGVVAPDGMMGLSPEVARESFEALYSSLRKDEMKVQSKEGAEMTVCSFEILVDPGTSERDIISDFGIRATLAGYKQVLGPIVLSNAGARRDKPTRRLNAIYFFLEKPSASDAQSSI